MKLLSVVRHGKAQSRDEVGSDLERGLLSKGRKDLHRLRRPLAKASEAVDFIVTSPARRAVESSEFLAQDLGFGGRIHIEDALYEAAPSTVLDTLSNMPEDANHVLLVAHNPGIEGLISGLCAGASQRMNIAMPTAALAHLELEIYWWQQIRWGCGILQALVTPTLLKKK